MGYIPCQPYPPQCPLHRLCWNSSWQKRKMMTGLRKIVSTTQVFGPIHYKQQLTNANWIDFLFDLFVGDIVFGVE